VSSPPRLVHAGRLSARGRVRMYREKLVVVGAAIVVGMAHELDMPVQPDVDRLTVPVEAAVRPGQSVALTGQAISVSGGELAADSTVPL